MAAWSTGLCDCCSDCGVCCYGFFCTSCLFGENAYKIDETNCFRACCAWRVLSLTGLCCLVSADKRQALRRRYGLQEDCNDCMVTTFCALCAICQEARELKFRSTPYGGPTAVIVQPMGGNVYQSAGQPMGGNVYPPPGHQMGGNVYQSAGQQMGGNVYPPPGHQMGGNVYPQPGQQMGGNAYPPPGQQIGGLVYPSPEKPTGENVYPSTRQY